MIGQGQLRGALNIRERPAEASGRVPVIGNCDLFMVKRMPAPQRQLEAAFPRGGRSRLLEYDSAVARRAYAFCREHLGYSVDRRPGETPSYHSAYVRDLKEIIGKQILANP